MFPDEKPPVFVVFCTKNVKNLTLGVTKFIGKKIFFRKKNSEPMKLLHKFRKFFFDIQKNIVEKNIFFKKKLTLKNLHPPFQKLKISPENEVQKTQSLKKPFRTHSQKTEFDESHQVTLQTLTHFFFVKKMF